MLRIETARSRRCRISFCRASGRKKRKRRNPRKDAREENPRGTGISSNQAPHVKCPTNTPRRVSLARKLNETSRRTPAKTSGADLNEESKIDANNGAASARRSIFKPYTRISTLPFPRNASPSVVLRIDRHHLPTFLCLHTASFFLYHHLCLLARVICPHRRMEDYAAIRISKEFNRAAVNHSDSPSLLSKRFVDGSCGVYIMGF